MIEGFIEAIRPFQVRGWAYDSEAPDQPLAVTLSIADVKIITGSASLFRDDLLHSGKGNGKHGFVLNVDRPLSMEAPDRLRVECRSPSGEVITLSRVADAVINETAVKQNIELEVRSSTPYTPEFYEDQKQGSLDSAEVVVPFLIELFHPKSVIDVGCGVGPWASAFLKNGVDTVLGVDGSYVKRADLMIPSSCYYELNLETVDMYTDLPRFDLALCLEVAEHIPKENAESFVRFLGARAPIVVFGAAVPWQGGTGHINEQWPTYWENIFRNYGYILHDILRPRMWNDPRIAYWYRQNTLVFVIPSVLLPETSVTFGSMTDIIHPELYIKKAEKGRHDHDRINELKIKAAELEIETIDPPHPTGAIYTLPQSVAADGMLPSAEGKIPVICINLDGDIERWSHIERLLPSISGIDLHRLPATNGRQLSDNACHLLVGSEQWISRRGEIGCFLSHVRAWEIIAKSLVPFCVVIEDDISLLGFERIEMLKFPDKFDIIFINDRTSPGGRDSSICEIPVCLPISRSLDALNRTKDGVGSDGYLITPVAAQKLLDATEKDLYFGNIDWRLMRYCVSEELLNKYFINSRVDLVIKNHHNPLLRPAWNILLGYCLSHPLVGFGTFKSRIDEDWSPR